MNITEVIGKSNVYYTLWLKSVQDGIATYTYVKNISEEFDKARALYPDAEFLDWLRGQGKFIVSDTPRTEPDYEPGTFFFGKHIGKNIMGVPESYLQWFYNYYDSDLTTAKQNDWLARTRTMIEFLLCTKGYSVVDLDGRKIMAENRRIIRASEPDYDEAGNIRIIPLQNPDCDGYLVSGSMTVHFPDVKKMTYNGFEYYLPAVKGKGKKIKNKTVVITDYEIEKAPARAYDGNIWLDSYNVEVKNFKVM